MKYVFSIRSEMDSDFNVNLCLDSFYHVKSYDLFCDDDKVNPATRYYDTVKLLGKDGANKKFPNLEKLIEQDSLAIQSMSMRARMNHMSIHMLLCDVEIDRDDMECIISMKKDDGTLSNFLRDSQI